MSARERLRRVERWGVWSARAAFSATKDDPEHAASQASKQDVVARLAREKEYEPTDDCVLTRIQMEQSRIRAELGSVQSASASVTAPPSGRVFDSAPDQADEVAYDALEKAYNLAFAVCIPERLERSQRADSVVDREEIDGSMLKETFESEDAFTHVLEMKRQGLEQAEIQAPNEANSYWKSEEQHERERTVAKLRDSIWGQDESRDGGSCLRVEQSKDAFRLKHVLDCHPSVLDQAKLFSTARMKRHRVLLHLAEACRSRALGRSRLRQQVENGYPLLTSVPPKLQIPTTPDSISRVPLQASPGEDVTEISSIESRKVSDCLASELASMASFLTLGHDHDRIRHPVAFEKSRQLWREQQRARADYDVESQRWKEDYAQTKERANSAAGGDDQNPFQRLGETRDNPWKSSLKCVEYADCQLGVESEQCMSPFRESSVNRALEGLYNRGLNAVVLSRGDGVRHEIASFILQLQDQHSSGHTHLLVTEKTRQEAWGTALTKHGIQVFSQDRSYCQPPGTAEKEQHETWTPRVLLISIESLGKDLSTLALFPMHLCIFDIDYTLSSRKHADTAHLWRCFLSLRCRQRLLFSTPDEVVDIRELVLFTYPLTLSSRRKMTAWNCASLSKRQVASIVHAVTLCAVCTDVGSGVLADWSARLEARTLENAQREKRTLKMVAKEVAEISDFDEGDERPMRSIFSSLNAGSSLGEVATEGHKSPLPFDDRDVDALKTRKMLPSKRRPSTSTPRSRKRISRCGTCAGCLANDCMKCGHCQDMKKYGGPGLRKQSCKRRKCLKPKTWGLKRKKIRSDASFMHEEHDATDAASSGEDNSDLDSAAEEGHSAISSDESEVDGEGLRNGGILSAYDSDSNDSSHFSEELMDSTGNELLYSNEDADLFGGAPEMEGHSRAGRSRVMRCGKCRGCTSGDCMKCIHCRDMKKYGGPGLRKQSCKYRKCVAPKVVLLNQLREKHEEDADEDVASSRSEVTGDGDGEVTTSPSFEVAHFLQCQDRLESLLVVQECALAVRKFQFFDCGECAKAFTSQKELDRHVLCAHDDSESCDAWERVAEDWSVHPGYQLGCLLASRKNINPDWRAPTVRAYAKLEGLDFEYFFLKPFATIGRLTQNWKRFYEARGISNPKGLPGGSLDCHIGNDAVIADQHALIKWDSARGCFTVECLSFRSSLSVNGHDVPYSSRPHRLRSRDLIQVGASTAYFLLPVSADAPVSDGSRIPRAEMRAWVDAAVTKRQAQAAQDEAIASEIRRQLTA